MNMYRIYILEILFIVFTMSSYTQKTTESLWKDKDETILKNVQNRIVVPTKYRIVELNLGVIRGALEQAPIEFSELAKEQKTLLSLPMPDSTMQRFRVVYSPIMSPKLASKYPKIKTYCGQGIDDKTATCRLDITPAGFHAIVFTSKGAVYIDPSNKGSTSIYISYFKRDARIDPKIRGSYEPYPAIGEQTIRKEERLVKGQSNVEFIGQELRTYRAAIAATGEYTQFHGGTIELGLAAVVTSLNRITGIYERDVAIRMELVDDNDMLIYTDPDTDPYTNGNVGEMLGQNLINIDNVIGNTNYDIGHVFGTGNHGIAYLRAVCGGYKAGGVSCQDAPIGDPFSVDYASHEIGHQFGANHTFYGDEANCYGNQWYPTAYEPGSGSTIMAYAGTCGSQNLQPHSDHYFHRASINEIVNYSTSPGGGNNCAVRTPTGNSPPVVNAGPSGYMIPINTPFVITGSATDPDGDDLTYCWEEFDSPEDNEPLFRSFLPTTVPFRTFPKLSDLLNNTQTIGEVLPTYDRCLCFVLTVRDNRAGCGANAYAGMCFNVTSSAGPFVVSSPNTAVTWNVLSTQTITWDVANTNLAAVNCTTVNILLSLDGGYTYPIALASNTPNDGTEEILVPVVETSQARVKIEAVNNIFFDISNSNFNIEMGSEPISGIISRSAIWDADEIVVGNLTINNGAILTINPGCNIYIAEDCTIEVSSGSKIIAQGTEANNIRFMKYDTNPWGKILLRGNDNEFRWCIFEGGNNNVEIISGTGTKFAHCVSRDAQQYGIYSDASYLSSYSLDTCNIEENGEGIVCVLTSLTMNQTTIQNNDGRGLAMYYSSTLNFTNNVIENNGEYGIWLGPWSVVYLGTGASYNSYYNVNSMPTGAVGAGKNRIVDNNTTVPAADAYQIYIFNTSRLYVGMFGGTNGSGFCGYNKISATTATNGKYIYNVANSVMGETYQDWEIPAKLTRWEEDGSVDTSKFYGPVDYSYPLNFDPTTDAGCGSGLGKISALAAGGVPTTVLTGSMAEKLSQEQAGSLNKQFIVDLKSKMLEVRRKLEDPENNKYRARLLGELNSLGILDPDDGTGERNNIQSLLASYYKRLISKEPLDEYERLSCESALVNELGNALQSRELNRVRELLESYSQYVKDKDNKLAIYFAEIVLYESLGDYSRAWESLKSAKAIVPDEQRKKWYVAPDYSIIENNISEKAKAAGITLREDQITKSGNQLPKEITLHNNYPNPFNPMTNINYELPASAYVTLKVYDIMGREVAVLQDGMKEAGYWTATFDASRLSSGVYFYRLVVGQDNGNIVMKVRKMLLLK